MILIPLTVFSIFFLSADCCVKTVSPDDLIPPGSCLLDCTVPYTCTGVTAPGGNCETLAAIGNPKVTTTDHVTCSFTLSCPLQNYGTEGYQTWYLDPGVGWSDIFGTNGDTIPMSCTAGSGNIWDIGGLMAPKFACAS